MTKTITGRPRAATPAGRIRGFVKMNDELLLIALVAVAVAAFTFAQPSFLAVDNLLDIGQQSAIVAVVAFGMTGVIVARGIDISVGGTMASAGIVAAMVVDQTGSGILGFLSGILVGAIFGGINALLIAGLGISSFVATLGTMALAKGTALSVSHASSILVTDKLMLWAGQSNLLGVPTGLFIALVLCALWTFMLKRSVLGKSIYAVGGNALAAQASLISVKKTQTAAYVLCGASAGVAAIIGVGGLGSAQPLAGTGLEFAAITAAVVGGASLSGGKGSAIGTLLGAVAIGTINSGLSFLQVSQQVTYMVSGVMILAAVLARGGLPWRSVLKTKIEALSHTKHDSPDDARRALIVSGLSKQFGGVRVLSQVSFELKSGEVVALMGENGAGKSTLIKCISGVHMADEGMVQFTGSAPDGSNSSRPQDIAVIHQHFSLVPDLTIAESLALGREPIRGFRLHRAAMRKSAKTALREVGLNCDVDTPVRQLTVGQRQMLEVAKALMTSAWLVVMDEPTSALSNRERDELYVIVEKLKKNGSAVLYISHKMEEVRALASRAIVLRDGKLVKDVLLDDISERELVHLMVGRNLGNVFPWSAATIGKTMVAVEGLSGGLLRDVSLKVRQGEVVGLAGLMGSGRSDILRCIAGMDKYLGGLITLQGATLTPGDQSGASRQGVAFVPEDRHLEGIVGGLSIAENLGLVWMRRNSLCGIVSSSGQRRSAAGLIKQLDIRPPMPGKLVGTLSGGNQQKVVIGKWLAVNPAIVLLDEPTSGVDVGAKSEIHKVIGALKAAGAAILLVSSELPELLGVSDRIVVIREGRSVGELPRGANERDVMELAFGSVASKQQEALA